MKSELKKIVDTIKDCIGIIGILLICATIAGIIGGSIKTITNYAYNKGRAELVQELCEKDSSYDFCEVSYIRYVLKDGE